jgi:hypothetical protein
MNLPFVIAREAKPTAAAEATHSSQSSWIASAFRSPQLQGLKFIAAFHAVRTSGLLEVSE